MDYEGALKHFLLIDGYKDSNKRIKYLKQTLAPWDVDIRFTESYNKDIDAMDKDSSIYIEITFSTPDKSNYFVSEIVFIFPDGQRDSFSPESMIEHDETLEFEFVNGFYQDSNYRPTGTFTVEVYYTIVYSKDYVPVGNRKVGKNNLHERFTFNKSDKDYLISNMEYDW